jgi:hypothetical protein
MTTDGYMMAPCSLVEAGRRWLSANPKVPPTFEQDPDDLRDELTPTGRWVHDQLQRYRYKPNVSWSVRPATGAPRDSDPYRFAAMHFADVVVDFCMWVLDSRGGERVIAIKARRAVEPWITDMIDIDKAGAVSRFRYWLKDAIRDVEGHEFDEWFRCDGELVNDPHAQPQPSQIGPIHR